MKQVPHIWTNYKDAGETLRLSLVQAHNRELLRFDYTKELELIGAELHRLRKARGHSLEQVARAIKMRKYRLCLIEHGMYIHFDLRHLYKLSQYYNTTPYDVLSIIPDSHFDDIDVPANHV